MSARRNQSKFQNTASLMVEILILIDFYTLTWLLNLAFLKFSKFCDNGLGQLSTNKLFLKLVCLFGHDFFLKLILGENILSGTLLWLTIAIIFELIYL